MNLSKKLSYKQCIQFIKDNERTIKRLYIDKDLTARVVAEKLNVHYDNNFQKALLRTVGAKGRGLGGSRQGAGNKKGISFCKVCRKKKPCNCQSQKK